jgi:hypothetical protein
MVLKAIDIIRGSRLGGAHRLVGDYFLQLIAFGVIEKFDGSSI